MSRVFDEWYLNLSDEEQREFHDRAAQDDAAGWAAWEAEERARLEAEPELPFPPLPERPRLPLDEDVPF